MKDDLTGEKLERRSDDNAVTLVKRLESYHSMTTPVAAYYKGKGKKSIFISIYLSTRSLRHLEWN